MDKKERDRQLSMDFKDTFGSPFGKRVLEKLDGMTTLNRPIIKSDKTIDPNRLIYEEGQRAMMLYIHSQINKDLGLEKKAKAKNDRGS